MKKYFLLLISAGVLFFSGCGKRELKCSSPSVVETTNDLIAKVFFQSMFMWKGSVKDSCKYFLSEYNKIKKDSDKKYFYAMYGMIVDYCKNPDDNGFLDVDSISTEKIDQNHLKCHALLRNNKSITYDVRISDNGKDFVVSIR